MDKFRIAIVCDAINNFTAGSFVSALRFSELLHKRGHKVIIISSRYPGNPKIDNYKGIKMYRLRSFPVPNTKKRLFFAYPSVLGVKRILMNEGIEIVHFMVPTPLAISSIAAAKSLKLKIVGHSHTQPDNWTTYIPSGLHSVKDGLMSLSYKYIIKVYQQADVLVCPSEFSQRILRSKGFKKKTVVISNGVDTNRFRARNADKMMKRLGLSQSSKKLLFVGRLDPEKNIETLIRAVPLIQKRVQNVEVCIVGDGYKRDHLQKLASAVGVSGTVRFLGRVSDEDLVGMYNICHVFVHPSLVELEGMVVLEAISCGKPLLIARSRDSASRFIVKKNGLLFNPQSPKDLASKAILLLKNDKLRGRMAKESLRMRQEYDIQSSMRTLEDVYARVLGSSEKSGAARI